MIGLTEVVDLLHEAQRSSGVDAELVLDIDTEALPLLTEWCAMYGIVAALAATDPYDTNAGKCPFCKEHAPAPHHFSCLYRRARAFIGPTSGERLPELAERSEE